MSIPPPAGPRVAARSASARRARFGTMTAVLVLAATVSLVVVNILGARVAARIDVTSTREHRLSPRTLNLLAGLEPGYEVVIAAPIRDRRAIDPRALERVADVLDKLRRVKSAKGSAPIQPTLIDTGSASGMAAYESLLQRLGEREKAKIKQSTDALATAVGGIEQLAAALEALSPKLQAVQEAIPSDAPGAATNRAYFEQRAAEARVGARSLKDLADKARKVLAANLSPIPTPDIDAAADLLRQPITDVTAGLADIAENCQKFATAANMPAPALQLAKPAAADASAQHDRAAVIRDTLDRLPRLDILRIAKALQTTSVALVIGPTGLTAIDLEQLFPPASAIDAAGGTRADLGRNAEELIGTAIASIAQPIKPIVVTIHGQPIRGFTKSPDFAILLDRLALRGIDVVEWAASLDAEPPAVTKLDPAGNRPVVCIALDTDTTQNPPGIKGQNGPERAERLGKALASVINSDEPLLLSLNPSTLPTYGQPDPVAAVLGKFGLSADTARPLLRERFTPEGRSVDAFQSVRATEGTNPLLGATKGLPIRLEWPIALHEAKPEEGGGRTTVTPLIQIADPAAWGESQWLTYWQIGLQNHAKAPNKPAKDSEKDDTKGPWTVAAAAERTVPGLDKAQRLVVVGSNTWFRDAIAQERVLVDGRPTLSNPGNAELFEAAIYWLAGQDQMIAQSATARAAPLIRPMSGATLPAIRWLAIAGLPALVLLAGMAWRLLRG